MQVWHKRTWSRVHIPGTTERLERASCENSRYRTIVMKTSLTSDLIRSSLSSRGFQCHLTLSRVHFANDSAIQAARIGRIGSGAPLQVSWSTVVTGIQHNEQTGNARTGLLDCQSTWIAEKGPGAGHGGMRMLVM